MAQSRQPFLSLLGTNIESVAMSLANKTTAWFNRVDFVNWLQLKNNFQPRCNTMNITQSWTNTFSVTGTGTDQFDPVTAHTGNLVQITGFTLGTGNTDNGFTLDGDALVIPEDGYYIAAGWLNFRHTVNSSAVGVVFGIEKASNPGTIIYGARANTNTKPNGDRLGGISGDGELPGMEAGDKLSVWALSDTTGTIYATNASLILRKYSD